MHLVNLASTYGVVCESSASARSLLYPVVTLFLRSPNCVSSAAPTPQSASRDRGPVASGVRQSAVIVAVMKFDLVEELARLAVIVAVLYLALGALVRGGRAAWSTPLSKRGVASLVAFPLAGRRFEALLIAASVTSSAIVAYTVALSAAFLWISLIALSRLVPGVHWPTDVLAAARIGACLPLAMAVVLEPRHA